MITRKILLVPIGYSSMKDWCCIQIITIKIRMTFTSQAYLKWITFSHSMRRRRLVYSVMIGIHTAKLNGILATKDSPISRQLLCVRSSFCSRVRR
jgi:hypothetical protein